jgi:hypothetical protein
MRDAFCLATSLGILHMTPSLAGCVSIATARNAGLAKARCRGWRRVMFLDDDIRGLDPAMVTAAAAMLDDYPAVAFLVTDYADHSVVYHAAVAAGDHCPVQPAGSALLLNLDYPHGTFPGIYNEDWFFLHDLAAAGLIGIAGECQQVPYDPFADPARARREEFGDLIAEGLYRLIREDRPLATSKAFWLAESGRRDELITSVAGRTSDERVLRCLDAARKELAGITVSQVEQFISDWRR